MVTAPISEETYDDPIRPSSSIRGWDWLTLRCFRTWITRTTGKFHGQRGKNGRRVPVPTYAIDDQTAIKVVDGAVEVVSEGHWKLFPGPA